MMRHRRLIGALSQSLGLVALVTGLLLWSPVSAAELSQEVDLRLRMRFGAVSEYYAPGGDVLVMVEATHNDGRTNSARVEIYFPTTFTNVRILSEGGYQFCDVSPATFNGAPAVKAACAKDTIDSKGTNGKGEDSFQVMASAPRDAGQYPIVGVITPITATEIDPADNRRQLDVKIASSSRTAIPRNVITRPIQPPPGTSGR